MIIRTTDYLEMLKKDYEVKIKQALKMNVSFDYHAEAAQRNLPFCLEDFERAMKQAQDALDELTSLAVYIEDQLEEIKVAHFMEEERLKERLQEIELERDL